MLQAAVHFPDHAAHVHKQSVFTHTTGMQVAAHDSKPALLVVQHTSQQTYMKHTNAGWLLFAVQKTGAHFSDMRRRYGDPIMALNLLRSKERR
jgi:hypothetical protein